jgi:hypothetical protein
MHRRNARSSAKSALVAGCAEVGLPPPDGEADREANYAGPNARQSEREGSVLDRHGRTELPSHNLWKKVQIRFLRICARIARETASRIPPKPTPRGSTRSRKEKTQPVGIDLADVKQVLVSAVLHHPTTPASVSRERWQPRRGTRARRGFSGSARQPELLQMDDANGRCVQGGISVSLGAPNGWLTARQGSLNGSWGAWDDHGDQIATAQRRPIP